LAINPQRIPSQKFYGSRTKRAAKEPSSECLTGLEKKKPLLVTKSGGTNLSTGSMRKSWNSNNSKLAVERGNQCTDLQRE